MTSPKHALILGGTGAIGGATARRLAERGWRVDVTGRDATAMPAELTALAVRFHAVDRADAAAIAALAGDGVDLLVDLVAYTAADVERLVPVMRDAASVVVASSRAVYVDRAGRHINGDEPPRFDVPIAEDAPTLPPAGEGVDPFSREGYAPSKAAVERAALDTGAAVTVLRPSKVHGRWARNARTRVFVERMLRGEPAIALADRGASVDHLTAAANTAALIEVVAERPGARILNSADPDTPDARAVVEAIGQRLGWRGRLDLLAPGTQGGDHPPHGPPNNADALSGASRRVGPGQARHPIVLDTTAARALGYEPVGGALELLADEVDWVAEGFSATLR